MLLHIIISDSKQPIASHRTHTNANTTSLSIHFGFVAVERCRRRRREKALRFRFRQNAIVFFSPLRIHYLLREQKRPLAYAPPFRSPTKGEPNTFECVSMVCALFTSRTGSGNDVLVSGVDTQFACISSLALALRYCVSRSKSAWHNKKDKSQTKIC